MGRQAHHRMTMAIIDSREILLGIHVTVRMPRLFGLRLWVAAKLVALAGVVSGTNMVVEMDDDAAEGERPSLSLPCPNGGKRAGRSQQAGHNTTSDRLPDKGG